MEVRPANAIKGREPALKSASSRELLAQTELVDDDEITGAIRIAQIIEQTGSRANHHQQSAPTRVIFLVRSQMPRQLHDALGEQCDLHLGRAGIIRFAPIGVNQLSFAVFCDRHAGSHHLRQQCLLLPRTNFMTTFTLLFYAVHGPSARLPGESSVPISFVRLSAEEGVF